MTAVPWEQANRDALMAELAAIRARLRGDDPAEAEAAARLAGPDRPTALDEVAAGFGLSGFERAVLLLVAGPELAAATAADIEAAAGDPRPTFGLALSVLPEPHWGAVTPVAPLRRWHLIQLVDPASPTRSPLVVPERVLHHLVGAGHLDTELAAVARPVTEVYDVPGAPVLRRAAADTAAAWAEGRPVVLSGPQRPNLTAVASVAARFAGGQHLYVIDAADMPPVPADRDRFLRLLERESVLSGCAWAVDLGNARAEDAATLLRALPGIDVPVVVLSDGAEVPVPERAARVDVPRLAGAERVAATSAALRRHCAPDAVPDEAATAAAANVFDLPVPDIEAAAEDVARGRPLWEACRVRAHSRFAGMAQVIEPRASWSDLVLPDAQLKQLRTLVAAVRHRGRVLDDWGFAARTARGLGTSALFAGPSGTGKTLAAEVIAHTLRLDLVVVDVSRTVDKYIGETEKNLARVFEAAEDSAAVLLFDEADTLFGKRTEVRDSHDRYANLEVGYLLQRMESFRGLAILTTNNRSALDQAFLRRLRVVVTFPYPNEVARTALWTRAFPAGTPAAGDLDPHRLATVDLPGGGIASAALTAAYLAAERGEITAEDVATATQWELGKTGRTVGRR